jgi:hypothetical protein
MRAIGRWGPDSLGNPTIASLLLHQYDYPKYDIPGAHPLFQLINCSCFLWRRPWKLSITCRGIRWLDGRMTGGANLRDPDAKARR